VKASLTLNQRTRNLQNSARGAGCPDCGPLMKSKGTIRITLAAVGNIGQADRCFPCSLDERRRSAWPNI